MFTPYHSKYAAYDLTKLAPPGSDDQLSMSLFDASVDLNPHQIEAAMFVLQSPLAEGAILADEVGLGKTIEAGIVLCQKWAERKRKLIIICPAAIRQHWAAELTKKFNLPAVVIDARTYRQMKADGIPFGQHLYYPLLSPIKDAVVPLKMRPLALGEPSEVRFVEDVMAFYDSPSGKEKLRGLSLYLLRNADNRAKGLGFALAGNFYPDFLLWLVDDKTGKQWLSFIDPKGIRNLNISDPKFGLHREIKQIEKQLGDGMISLNSFILSVTTFNDLLNVTGSTTKSDLEDRNVLFMDDGGPTYLDKLLAKALA